ncbi:MAG TPA: hypothetical protein VKB95_04885 [Chitinophagaceae bacterium]|nr:hypothetical protein [Chitinophagaceae bacterium]
MKKVIVLYNATGGTSEQYDKVWDCLRAAGKSNPKGLISHAGGTKPDDSWFVCDIWESEEDFVEFCKVLLPAISIGGLPLTVPVIFPAHYVYIS